MIVDRIENLEKYIPYMPELRAVCDFLRNTDAKTAECGHYDINGDLYVNVQEYSPAQGEVFEYHRKYIDLQYVVCGDEEIDSAPLSQMEDEIEYKEEIDAGFYKKATASFSRSYLSEGSFAILEPRDAHRPGMKWNSDNVKKMIFKIKVK